jgi:hypothetical protein
MDQIIEPIKFEDYLEAARKCSNPVAFLVYAFERLHTITCPADKESFGRMGRIWNLYGKDTGYLMKVIWTSAADNIAGSRLNYIQAKVRNDVGKFHRQGNAGAYDPDKFKSPLDSMVDRLRTEGKLPECKDMLPSNMQLLRQKIVAAGLKVPEWLR